MVETLPKVSIIIPARDAMATLGRAVESVLNATKSEDVEIIIVNDGLDRAISELAHQYPVKMINGNGNGPAAARNIGVQSSSGEMLIFLDADCRVSSEWLESHLEAHKRYDGLLAVGGSICLEPDASFWARCDPITPLLAVLAAEACDRLALTLRMIMIKSGRLILYSALFVLLVLNLPPFTPLHERDRVVWEGWLTHVIHSLPLSVVIGQESQEEYLGRHVPSYSAWRYINTNLPHDARILTFSGGDHYYSNRERIWIYATIARPALKARIGQERLAFQTLRELGISHLLFDKKELHSLEPGTMAIAEP